MCSMHPTVALGQVPIKPPLGLLTCQELALELKCSPRHIKRLAARHVIPRIVISSKVVRYRRDSVLAALVRREEI